MANIIFYPHPERDPAYQVTRQAASICADTGASVCLAPGTPFSDPVLFRGDPASPDFAVVLGGDGAMLRAARLFAPSGIPMIGVNLGNIGFLTELDRDHLARLRDVCHGNYTIEERMMLDVSITRGDTCLYHAVALNDCIISRGATMRNIRLRLAADGAELNTIYGDGVIVATPTGSTAYSLSAGGPIVDPAAEVLAVTPICPHALHAKSFLLDGSRTVTVTVELPEGKDARLSCDGVDSVSLADGDCIRTVASAVRTRLIKLSPFDFFSKLNAKLSAW